jgi:hypothetical protein
MDYRRRLLEPEAVLVQDNPHPLGTHRDATPLGQVSRQKWTGLDGLLKTVPPWIVPNGIDQQVFVLLVPARRPTVTTPSNQSLQPAQLESIKPTMDGALVNAQQLAHLGHTQTITCKQHRVAPTHQISV